MFTGIIEYLGTIKRITPKGTNVDLLIESNLTPNLKIDESIAHNGICLTITDIYDNNTYQVTAIDETIAKTTIGSWIVGDQVNLEQAMQVGARLDGHFVQGHVDTVITCASATEQDGSWLYTFNIAPKDAALIVEKGSVCINGTSLTCFNVTSNSFTVAIIPYTYQHTTIKSIHVGSLANIEYDIIGKYILRKSELQNLPLV